MTKRQKDEPGAAVRSGDDTFARLAKSAEKPPRLVEAKTRTRVPQDKREARSARSSRGRGEGDAARRGREAGLGG